ncbi:HNH endonuclease [Flavobacterium sp.]|uniref:HNH endonuclease n=1 Tax=Flavobacterium sp. TaxID=239 RepID=UPI00263012E6|nr:HNH endonuclease [Flavobacterium sp.]
MRPIFKGNTPQLNGVDKIVTDYKDWRSDLIERIGNYCCYCNMILNDSPQVEHVVPKNPQTDQPAGDLLAWENMLLACGPCNREKGNKPHTSETHYMPDKNNTHLVFEYFVVSILTNREQKAGLVRAFSTLGFDQLNKANNTISLLGLNTIKVNPRATDLRWKYRAEAWFSANEVWRTAWNNGLISVSDFTPLLLDAAKSKGFFSIWFKAFDDVPQIKIALINGFKGTDSNSFENIEPFNPKNRNPENVVDTI